MIETLETTRLTLKPMVLEYAPYIQKNFEDYELVKYLSRNVPWPYPKDGAESFLKNQIIPFQGNSKWTWAIALKERPDAIIGSISLWKEGIPEHRGFWLSREHWNKGLMTEACNIVNTYAFEKLGFEELIFSNASQNTASRKIKEKTGCEFIGHSEAQFVDRSIKKSDLWRLTKERWQKSK